MNPGEKLLYLQRQKQAFESEALAVAEEPQPPPGSPVKEFARTAGIGALLGGAAGAGKVLFTPPKGRWGHLPGRRIPEYLKGTLAGALIGGTSAVGLKALGALEPWEREAPWAKAVEAVGTTTEEIKRDPTLLMQDPQKLLLRYLGNVQQAARMAKGDVTPQEQQELANLLVTAQVPTAEGFKNRVSHLKSLAGQLTQGNTFGLSYNIEMAKQYVRDPQTLMLLNQAQQVSRTDVPQSRENRTLLAAIGRRVNDRLQIYRRAQSAIGELHGMRSAYAEGKMNERDVARRMGVLTGRFVAKDPEVRDLMMRIIEEPMAA